ncbi:MAG: 16S rRNA (uracil(1498)-N(3))-methyltransferase [Dehalococcoidia bacterium]
MGRRLYLDPEEFASSDVLLVGSRARRLREVLRLRVGASLEVFDGHGRQREAKIVNTGKGQVTLVLGDAVDPVEEPPVPVIVVCAFPRASRGDWLVEKATEIGVSQLVPRLAARSVMEPGDGRIARWRRIAIEAAEQCERCFVPAIGGEPPAGATHIVADPDAETTVRDAVHGLAEPPRALVLHIGPEGGWSGAEIEDFRALGAHFVSLGPRLMRVETAAVIAAAQLLEATGGLAPTRGQTAS